MRKLILLLLPLTLAACQPSGPGDGASSAGASSVTSSSPTERPLAKEGEFCGGIAAFACEPGLRCRLDGTYPDAGGTCVRR
jgi:hypothetical protein